jgi:BioD-like phosphotransacetylase family protein
VFSARSAVNSIKEAGVTVLYVVSDQQGAGKTALCATLARKLAQQGKKVTVFKPISGAGSAPDTDPDVRIYGKLLGIKAEGWPVDSPAAVKDAVNRLSEEYDVVIAEGSNAMSLAESKQVADALDSKVVAVAQFRRDLSPADLKPLSNTFGERLIGFIINGLTKYLGTEVRTGLLPAMAAEGLPLLGIVPEDRRLVGIRVRQLVKHLDGRVIMEEGDMDALVEYLMVGGLSLDPAGETHFLIHDNRTIITRGDRPDIQMSALNAEGTTACMVLTNGKEPLEYIMYEAEQQEMPLILVDANTLDVMSQLNTLMDRTRFDHPRKLSRFAELLDEHVDMNAIFRALNVES